MNDEIITIEEVAQYLRVSERTVYDWAKKGEIPAGKIGTVWRFKKDEIERFLNERLSAGASSLPINSMHIKNVLSLDRIIFMNYTSKRDVLTELSQTLAKAPQIKNADELVSGIFKREELMTTAIGSGIAIPHVRLSSVTDLVMAVGICKNPVIDFNAIDDVPVSLVFMIAAAYSQHSYYLRMLSDLSAKLKNKDLRESLLSAETAEQVYKILTEN